uniref:Uncharacterized protein n=1 Tax=Ascaris lumbricoides TaxID=6252 RepID=A0A0M3HR61_ASCLU
MRLTAGSCRRGKAWPTSRVQRAQSQSDGSMMRNGWHKRAYPENNESPTVRSPSCGQLRRETLCRGHLRHDILCHWH